MKVYLTGGCGFVGSAIVRELNHHGIDPIVVDDLSTGRRENLGSCSTEGVVEVDAGAYHYTDADVVIHAAAYPDISANWKDASEREKQWRLTADLTRRVLEKCTGKSNRPLFIFLSTCAVYGGGEVAGEHSSVKITSPYAASKLASEALISAYDAAGRVHGRILRMVSAVGPRYSHGHIADFVRQVKETEKIHALDDGSSGKSFVHVRDVAREVMNLVAAHGGGMSIAHDNEPIRNVTSPTIWSWRDTVALMRAMRPDLKFEVTCEKRQIGWIGDPQGLHVSSWALKDHRRESVVEGVSEALTDLGWMDYFDCP